MAKRRKKRSNTAGYSRLIRAMARMRKQGRYKAWSSASKRASSYRKRMIAANRRHPSPRAGGSKACRMMDAETRKLYRSLSRRKDGAAVAKLFRKFWKIPCPPSIKMISGPGKKVVPLVGMGYTRGVYLSDKNKGKRGGRKHVLHGHWTVATEKTGRHVLLLRKRPIQGKLVPVGYAPETHYIPPQDVERAGTHKAGLEWRHRHGRDDSKGSNPPSSKLQWPMVYADRGGKVDGNSNFVYGKTPTAKITDWMYGN